MCGDKTGVLYTHRLGSGSKGKCIYSENGDIKWFTPKEFEKYGGRETSKDWKRSVKLDGKPFYHYVNMGALKIHAFNCYCRTCVGSDDFRTNGPIKFFIPPNRKRKAEEDSSTPSLPSMIPSNQASCSSNSVPPNLDLSSTEVNQLITIINQTLNSSDISEKDGSGTNVLLESDIISKLASSLQDLPSTSTSDESQVRQNLINDDFLNDIKTATNAIRSDTDVLLQKMSDITKFIHGINDQVAKVSKQIQLYESLVKATPGISRDSQSTPAKNGNLELVINIADTSVLTSNQNEAQRRKLDDSGHCTNCNRVAPFKCGRCNKVRYCSEFCQQRDWPIHNRICSVQSPKRFKTEVVEADVVRNTDVSTNASDGKTEEVEVDVVNNTNVSTNDSDAKTKESSEIAIKTEELEEDVSNCNKENTCNNSNTTVVDDASGLQASGSCTVSDKEAGLSANCLQPVDQEDTLAI